MSQRMCRRIFGLAVVVGVFAMMGCARSGEQQVDSPERSASTCDEDAWSARYKGRASRNGLNTDGFNPNRCIGPASDAFKD